MLRFLLLPALAIFIVPAVTAEPAEFDAFERSIPELQTALGSGETTSADLVRQYLDRIAAFDRAGPRLNAMIHVNPRVLEEAAALDRERLEKGARGPLHGIPVVLKDNFDTFDMPTTASAVALAGFVPSDDAYQVRKLREAGVVILGKTNLHEFARGIETISSLGGQTLNPYDPRRNPGGSSGGTAAAVTANFAPVGMGSDTCGSIRIPAANTNLFGLRVTQGLSSRAGIIPLSHTQDVAGPIARSMVDLATVLDATVGEDAADPQTRGADRYLPKPFRDFLDAGAMRGARLGVLTDYLDTAAPYGDVTSVVRAALAKMAENGAEVIDIRIAGLDELLAVSSVIDYEFTRDVDAYLRASNAPVRSIEELLASGRFHEALRTRYERSIKRRDENEEYRARLERREAIARLLLETMALHELDAIVYPALRVKPVFIGEAQYGSVCRLAAHSGFPAISIPAGFTDDGLPVGIELAARPYEDGRLVGLAFAWEQFAAPRRPPPRTPSLLNDVLSYDFVVESPQFSGRLTLDRPTQVLRYEFAIRGPATGDITGIWLHRGESGPVIERLGNALQGSIAVRNADLADLVRADLFVGMRMASGQIAGARIERR